MNDTTERIFQFAQQAKERFFGAKRGGILGFTTPKAVRSLPWPAQLALGAGTVLSLALLIGVSISAFGVLFAALTVIYLLLSQVLGISFELDPEAILRRVQAVVPPHERPN